MNQIEQDSDYLKSLKSIETENYIDRVFYRPIGFKIASALQHTPITPNMVTIISIVIGMAGAALFYFVEPIWLTLLGILGLVTANILDCVDGQLSRLTGIKSKWGRILDGFAGDLWFLTLYIAISMRLYETTGNSIWFVVACISLISHLNQAALTDLYKTFHLRFISKEKGKEFETYSMVKARVDNMEPGFSKFAMRVYSMYTKMQSLYTPNLQKFVDVAIDHNIEHDEEIKRNFRLGSRIVMKLVDLMTFNGRTIPLFIVALTGHIWLYFLYEIVFLWIVFFVARDQHETLCKAFSYEVKEKYEKTFR